MPSWLKLTQIGQFDSLQLAHMNAYFEETFYGFICLVKNKIRKDHSIPNKENILREFRGCMYI